MCKLSRQVFEYNHISYNNDVIITLLQHIVNPGIVRTIYSGMFRDIQQVLTMFRYIEGY